MNDQSKLVVSLAPHFKSTNSVKKMMYGVIIALLPALAAGILVFGVGAIKVILTAVLSCVVFEFLIQKYNA